MISVPLFSFDQHKENKKSEWNFKEKYAQKVEIVSTLNSYVNLL